MEPTPPPTLRDLLEPLLPAVGGTWAALARELGVVRETIRIYLVTNRLPHDKVAKTCDALGASPGLRAELYRRVDLPEVAEMILHGTGNIAAPANDEKDSYSA